MDGYIEYAQVRLEIPSLTVKLSDSFNGITLSQGFSVGLINNDGYFDDEDEWLMFNAPLNLRKTIKESIPYHQDFKIIRTGLVDDTTTNFDNYNVTVSDKLRAMDEKVCQIITTDNFSYAGFEAVGKNISIVYGTRTVRLIKLDNTRYLAAERLNGVSAVWDSNANSIPFTWNTNGVITVSDIYNPVSARVTGYTNNRIGEIVKDLVSKTRSLSDLS